MTFQKRGEVEDPGILEMDDKVLHQGDEVEVLANILKNMSLSMKAFVARLMESAHIMEDMKQEVTRANNLAMRDALTGVKSKAAYDQQEERLNLDIKAGDAEFGIVMICDEVMAGWCRTGKVMSFMHYGIKPDIVSMAKALGGGMPIGAICATEEVSKAFSAGSHGTTFGGHPVSCAAALAQVDELLKRDLAGNAAEMGEYFKEKLSTLPHVKEVRGQGLLVGVEFDDTIGGVDVKHECLHRHLLLTAIGAHTIRMVPPLIITKADCDEAVRIIKESVESLS